MLIHSCQALKLNTWTVCDIFQIFQQPRRIRNENTSKIFIRQGRLFEYFTYIG